MNSKYFLESGKRTMLKRFPLSAALGLFLVFGAQLTFKAVAAKGATKKTTSSRPTLRIAKGNTLQFSQYAAANGLVYGADGKLKINDIKQAWADVSDVVIDGTLEVKRTDAKTRATAIFIANKLTMNDGSRIVTNGNVLWVFVNEFVAFNNATILAFDANNIKAGDGPPQNGVGGVQGNNGLPGPNGNSGIDGEGGGVVEIFAANFSGPLVINLLGQTGGNGSNGGSGGDGKMGFKGENAEWFGPDCRHDGGGGGSGGAGGFGGMGGAGGRGGDGGVLGFFYVTSLSVDPPNNPKISVSAGLQGAPGQGGSGGKGGDGGLGGDGGGPCHGGPRGAWGAAGGSLGSGPAPPAAVAGSRSIIRLAALAKVQEQFAKAIGQ